MSSRRGRIMENGLSSEAPPEGLAGRFGVRVEGFSAVTPHDIGRGDNRLETPYGPVDLSSPCGYAVLEALGDSRPIARLGGRVVAVRSGDGRFTWFGLTLWAGFGVAGHPALVPAWWRKRVSGRPWSGSATPWSRPSGGPAGVGG